MKETQIELSNIGDVKDFCDIANLHDGEVTLYSGRYIVDAKSVMGIFSLDLSKPIKLEIEDPVSDEVREGINKYIVLS